MGNGVITKNPQTLSHVTQITGDSYIVFPSSGLSTQLLPHRNQCKHYQILVNSPLSSFIKIPSVVLKLLNADRYDQASKHIFTAFGCDHT
jgi:hypothetical protein